MNGCEICGAAIDDSDDALCARCEHDGDRPHLVEHVDDAAREQKMRFFRRYGD